MIAGVDERPAVRCLFCDDDERAEILEVWQSGEFMLDTCCEGMHEACSEFLSEDPKRAGAWLAGELNLDAMMGQRLRRVIDDGCGQLLLDWNLTVEPIAWRDAKAFVAEHHRHCPPPAGWRFGAAVRNGSQLIGVVIVGRPVARAIDHSKVVEVNRLCIRTDVPTGWVWNACSLLYGWAAREAKKRGFERIVTYTMQHEAGTTLKAAGWSVDGTVRGRSWNAPSRPRVDKTPTVDKVRWARELRA